MRNTPMENDAWNPSSVFQTFCVSPSSHLQHGWYPFPPIWQDVSLWEGLSPGVQLQYILNLVWSPLDAFRTLTGLWCVSLFLIGDKVSQMFTLHIHVMLINSLNDILDSLELFWDTCMCRGWYKMCVNLLVEKLPWQISVSDIDIPVLVPVFWPIARHIVPKNIDKTCVDRVTLSQCTIGVRHAWWVPLVNCFRWPLWHLAIGFNVKHTFL